MNAPETTSLPVRRSTGSTVVRNRTRTRAATLTRGHARRRTGLRLGKPECHASATVTPLRRPPEDSTDADLDLGPPPAGSLGADPRRVPYELDARPVPPIR